MDTPNLFPMPHVEPPDNPRRRCPVSQVCEGGGKYLTLAEVLAVLIGDASKGARLADAAAQDAGRVAQIAECSPALTDRERARVLAGLELARRVATTPTDAPPRLQRPEDVAAFMAGCDVSATQEEFWVLCVDAKHALLRADRATIGLVDRSQVHPREVFRQAILCASSAVILCHNHPSGDPTPSAQDVACTRNLVASGKVVGIDVVDHVVLGRGKWLSFRVENLL